MLFGIAKELLELASIFIPMVILNTVFLIDSMITT